MVRGRVPGGRREASRWEPYGVVPARQLPASAAIRGRIVSLTTEHRGPERSRIGGSGKRCIHQAKFLPKSSRTPGSATPSARQRVTMRETEQRFGAKSGPEASILELRKVPLGSISRIDEYLFGARH